MHAVPCQPRVTTPLPSLQEYTSEEEGSEPDADLENQYYQSKALKESSPSAAIGSFEKVRLLSTQLLVCIDRPVPHCTPLSSLPRRVP